MLTINVIQAFDISEVVSNYLNMTSFEDSVLSDWYFYIDWVKSELNISPEMFK